jgi:DNA repair protein RAD16
LDVVYQAEKTTIALYRHHPELKTCWGDLEKREVITPKKGVQPPELKVRHQTIFHF